MEKINVAELLKGCPKGMELDCTMFENVTFIRVDMGRKQFPIEIAVGGIRSKYLTKEGCFHDITLSPESKCVIFPKGKTTWEGFHRPYINGDIVYTICDSIAILGDRIGEHSVGFRSYCGLFNYKFDTNVVVSPQRLASEEEKQKLFLAIKDNGYRWNEETKTLEKLVEHRFKVGDRIRHKCPEFRGERIVNICCDTGYFTTINDWIDIAHQDDWELVQDKFDITTLKPFDKVLVRLDSSNQWYATWFSHIDKRQEFCRRYVTVSGKSYTQIIPYEGNEYLCGTKDNCDEYFKIWE